ncbi:MAG: hypothetical protein V7K38_01395 [Nostoc sp.]
MRRMIVVIGDTPTRQQGRRSHPPSCDQNSLTSRLSSTIATKATGIGTK